MSKVRLTLCGYMKYFYSSVLFLTMFSSGAMAKGALLGAKELPALYEDAANKTQYEQTVKAKDDYAFINDAARASKKAASEPVKIEVLAAKAEFEDIDDVIATIEEKTESDTPPTQIVFGEAEKNEAPKKEDDLLTIISKIGKASQEEAKEEKKAEIAEKEDTQPEPVETSVIAAEEKALEKEFEVASLKQDTAKEITTVSADDAALDEIIAEDIAWEEDWKTISSLETMRDDKAFDALIHESFSFLPAAPVKQEKQKEYGSVAAKMITGDDIEKLFAKEEKVASKSGSKIPDFPVVTYGDDSDWVWPVDQAARQRISSRFGYRVHPVTKRRSFHKGVDIAAPRGTKVLASRSGVVELVKRHRYLGKYVKIRHNDGSYALYGHLSSWNVRSGARVKAGQFIGRVGSTGRSTGPHLDFSIRVAEKAVDPLKRLSVPRKVARR